MEGELTNMKITGTSITMAAHGVVTFWLDLEGGSTGVSYGGYCIGHGYLGADYFDGSGKGIEAMARIMDVVGVENWEDLKGQYVRIVNPGWGGTAKKIGNILKDKWFDIEEFFSNESEEDVLIEASEKNTGKVVKKANDCYTEYRKYLQGKVKTLEEELASLHDGEEGEEG